MEQEVYRTENKDYIKPSEDAAINQVDNNDEGDNNHLAENEVEAESPHEKRGNFIFRQELSSCTPECNAKNALCCNFFMVILFAGVGIAITFSSQAIREVKLDYTDCKKIEGTNNCTMFFTLNTTLNYPLFVYYEMTNFYSNHRDYVKSLLWPQLRGEIAVNEKLNDACKPVVTMAEMFSNDSSKYHTYTGVPLKGDDYAVPCGLVARAFFNDTYSLYFSPEESDKWNKIPINETGITHEYDREVMYKNFENSTKIQWIDMSNEHFIVWMQMESLSTFRKLWGHIDQDLKNGTYKFVFDSKYNTKVYGGRKSIVISNTSFLGDALFYGYLLLFGAGYVLLFMLVITIIYFQNKSKKFDYNSLKWS